MKSLQWLRGWVSPAAVSDEFKDLQRYSAMSTSCLNCEKLVTKCEHPPPTIWEKLKDVGRKRTLKPFILIAFQCFIMQFCGIFAMRPYIVQVDFHPVYTSCRINQLKRRHIYWNKIYRFFFSDFESVRCAIGCKCYHRYTWIAWYFSKYWIIGDSKTIWQTENLFVVDGANIPQLYWSE